MIGPLAGLGFAFHAFLQRGFNISGLTTAAVSFVTGGETIQGIAAIWEDRDGTLREKAAGIGIGTLLGVTTGVITNKAVETICPQYSVARAFCVIAVGALTVVSSTSSKLPHAMRAVLGTAGRSASIAGMILFGASGISSLVRDSEYLVANMG